VIAPKRRPAIRAGIYSARGTLRPVAPFSFERTLDFLGAFTPAQSSHRVTNGTLTRAMVLDADVVVLRLESTGTTSQPRLRYTMWSGATISRQLQARAEAGITSWLSLDDDLRDFYGVAARDRRFAPVVKALHGYHQVKFLTPFECACWAVLTQRNRMGIARGMRDRLVERFGPALEVNGIIYRAFPEPARVARASDEELTAVVRQVRRARYVRAVAQAFDGVDPASLRDGDYGDIEAWLLAIPGIGPWSARFILLRGLGRMERIDGLDAVGSAFVRVYGDRAEAPAVARAAKRYGRWRGYWLHYLRAAPSGEDR
jgi:DNA-3-methyladenine glycosylase II